MKQIPIDRVQDIHIEQPGGGTNQIIQCCAFMPQTMGPLIEDVDALCAVQTAASTDPELVLNGLEAPQHFKEVRARDKLTQFHPAPVRLPPSPPSLSSRLTSHSRACARVRTARAVTRSRQLVFAIRHGKPLPPIVDGVRAGTMPPDLPSAPTPMAMALRDGPPVPARRTSGSSVSAPISTTMRDGTSEEQLSLLRSIDDKLTQLLDVAKQARI